MTISVRLTSADNIKAMIAIGESEQFELFTLAYGLKSKTNEFGVLPLTDNHADIIRFFFTYPDAFP